ncbi:MAG: hypothetical protein IJ228_08690 [Succinivibrio sp.]|nr:hypothetical protein [Succinivibrio sp.]
MNHALANSLPIYDNQISSYEFSEMSSACPVNDEQFTNMASVFTQMRDVDLKRALINKLQESYYPESAILSANYRPDCEISADFSSDVSVVHSNTIPNSDAQIDLLREQKQPDLVGDAAETPGTDLVSQLQHLRNLPQDLFKLAMIMAQRLEAVICDGKSVSYLPRVEVLYFRLKFARGFDVMVGAEPSALSEEDPLLAFNVSRDGRRLMTDALKLDDLLASLHEMTQLLHTASDNPAE